MRPTSRKLKSRKLVVLLHKLPNDDTTTVSPKQQQEQPQQYRMRGVSKFGLESEDDEDEYLPPQPRKSARLESNRLKTSTLDGKATHTEQKKPIEEPKSKKRPSVVEDEVVLNDEELKSDSPAASQKTRSRTASRSDDRSEAENKRARVEAQMIDQANRYLAEACQVAVSAARASTATPNQPVASAVVDHSSNFGICGMCKKDPQSGNAPDQATLSTGPFRITYKPCEHHCSICGFWSKNRLLVDDHMKQAHQFRCDACGVVFVDQYSADLHQFEQHKRQHLCELCDRIYPSEYAYRMHVSSEMHQRALRAQNNVIRDLTDAHLLVAEVAQDLIVQQEAVDERRPARERWWPKALVDVYNRDPTSFKRAVIIHKGFEIAAISSPPDVRSQEYLSDQRDGHNGRSEKVPSTDDWIPVEAPTSLSQQPVAFIADLAVDHFLRNLSPNSRAFASRYVQDQPLVEVQPTPQPIEGTLAPHTLQAIRHPPVTGQELEAAFGRAPTNSSMNTPCYMPQFPSSPAPASFQFNYSALDRDFREMIPSPLAFEMDRLNSFNSGAQPFMALLQL